MCGTALPDRGRGRPKVYCSRGCQARAYRRRAAPPTPQPAPPHPRRQQIAEAVWRIAAERGLHAASIREVAAEAGVSTRAVQYHFRGKHELLVAALRLLHQANERRARRRITADPNDPRALLRSIIDELLPLDAQRRATLRVFAAYYARSLTDPALAAVFLHDQHPLEDLVAAVIAQAQQIGATPSALDPRAEADILVSAAVSLGGDVLHGSRTLAEVRRTLDYHLTRILPPPAEADRPGAALR